MKTCTGCGRMLPLSAFGKHSITKDGLSYVCKECNRKSRRLYSRTASGVYTLLKGRQTYARTHKGKKNRGYHLTIKPLTISRQDFVEWYESQPQKCEYCKIDEEQLGRTGDKYNDKNLRLSVDCKDNEVGYSKGNLVLACNRCNAIKSDFFSHDEMLEIGKNHVTPRWLGSVKNGST